MNIKLYPQRRDEVLTVSKLGDALTINNVLYDFSIIPNGATLPSSAVDCIFIVGDIARIDGILHLEMIIPHGANPSNSVAFPAPLINPDDGVLEF